MTTHMLNTRRFPAWIAVLYGVLAVALLPWITYMAFTLPVRHVSHHWDISWVGLDIAIAALLVLNAVFTYFDSAWLVLSATASATLLCTDAWFDVMSARPGKDLIIAFTAALLLELPLALITLFTAVRAVRIANKL